VTLDELTGGETLERARGVTAVRERASARTSLAALAIAAIAGAALYLGVFTLPFSLLKLQAYYHLDLERWQIGSGYVHWVLFAALLAEGALYWFAWQAARTARGRAAWVVVIGGAGHPDAPSGRQAYGRHVDRRRGRVRRVRALSSENSHGPGPVQSVDTLASRQRQAPSARAACQRMFARRISPARRRHRVSVRYPMGDHEVVTNQGHGRRPTTREESSDDETPPERGFVRADERIRTVGPFIPQVGTSIMRTPWCSGI